MSVSLSLSDVDECQNRGVCLNGHCENLAGSYRCLCNEGFLPEADSKGCRGQWHTANKTKQHAVKWKLNLAILNDLKLYFVTSSTSLF